MSPVATPVAESSPAQRPASPAPEAPARQPRVVCYPADVAGCGLYRVIWPGEALASAGFDVNVYPPGHERRIQASLTKWPNGSTHVHEVVDPGADVCVFQRPLSRIMVEAMIELRRCGVKVVVELDDDFKAVSPRNSAFAAVHPTSSPDANWTHLDRAVRNCDLVTVTTPNLARRYGRWSPCVVLPNYVPARFLDVTPAPVDQPLTLGWSGAVMTHPDDLPVAARGVREALAQNRGSRFCVVGPSDGVGRQLGNLEVASTGWVPVAEYPDRLAELDVGIAPLEPSTFNASKSWLKPLEMAALGVPFVASPRQNYALLAELGIGRLAEGHKEWKWNLGQLLGDADRRAEEAARQRALVSELDLTIEAQAHRWWAAWTSI